MAVMVGTVPMRCPTCGVSVVADVLGSAMDEEVDPFPIRTHLAEAHA